MIVPQYWAESRIQQRTGQRTLTVRRFGWSDQSQDDAQAMAQARAQAALEQLLSGTPVPKIERKRAYNGADGVPIREEIISRHGPSIITRNRYGARCLNSPNVLFADIDLNDHDSPLRLMRWTLTALLAGLIGLLSELGLLTHWWIIGFLGWLCSANAIQQWLKAHNNTIKNWPQKQAMRKILRFVEQNPRWHLRVYRSPAGLRLLVMHTVFNANSPEVTAFFTAIGCDSTYHAMCRQQNCFRARVSAKPWRIGLTTTQKLSRQVWPVDAPLRATRAAWVAHYEAAARPFAACRFLHTLGSDTVAPEARAVMELHDRLSGANSRMPLA